jgi:HD-GYP domain-containing protein (c-di-GMP phosphodiesterase class II)
LSGAVQGIQYTFTGRRKDGSLIDIGVHGTQATYGGKPAIVGLLQDITGRRQAEERAKQYLVQIEKAMFGTIDAVTAMVDLRDPYTSGHQRRVGELAGAIGAEMGLGEDEVKGLRVTGRIHDVGKISVPAEILSKPGKLTPLEFEIIKSHAQQGYDILKSVEFPWPVAETVLQHHERLDGSGYPRGLKGEDISLPARIIAVADTIEAMATHRPYRPSLGIEPALKEIEAQSGTRYDAAVVAACLNLFRRKGYVLPA